MPPLGSPAATWVYRNANGWPLGVVARYENDAGKAIRPWTFGRLGYGPPGWKAKTWPTPRPLYGLDRLAAQPHALVVAVEGEKAADAAERLLGDVVAVTSPGGASAATSADWSPLSGRRVVVWPDHDDPGRRYADDVARLAREAGAEAVRVVAIPDQWPAGWDLADDAPEGVTAEDLRRMISEATAAHATASVIEVVEPDLRVLRGYRRAAPELLLDLFGRWGAWCAEAAEGSGAPADYVACALLAVAAGAIGNATRISPWPGWTEPAVLWVGLVGEPGSGKSPGTDAVLEAVLRAERRWAEPWEREHRQWEAAVATARAAESAWGRAVSTAARQGKAPPARPDCDPPREPQRPRLRISDTTPEAVGAIMVGNPRGLLLVRDELSGWLGSFGRYSGARAAERAFWIEAHGARPHVCDRVTTGRSVMIPRLAVSVFGTIQPARLDTLLLNGEDDGLPGRHLWSWPEPMPPRRPRRCADVAALENALLALRSLPMALDDHGDPEPVLMQLTPDAADLFQAWRVEQAERTQAVAGMMATASTKAPGAVLRLALVLGMLDVARTGAEPPAQISAATVERGIALWTGYFAPMAERVLGDAALPQSDRDAATLARWIASKRPATINARQLKREVRLPGLTQSERVRDALNALVEAGWLTPPVRDGRTGGRPRADFGVRQEAYAALDARKGGTS